MIQGSMWKGANRLKGQSSNYHSPAGESASVTERGRLAIGLSLSGARPFLTPRGDRFSWSTGTEFVPGDH